MSFPHVLVVFLALTGGSLAAVFSPAQEQQIEEFVLAAMDCFNTTGLTVAVVKGNESWTRGFGLADVERGVTVTSSTLFAIGSVTKAFTTTLLAMALNDTEYTWQSPLRQILGEQFHLANDQLTRQTTLRDILSHRTGLKPANLPLFANVYQGLSREDVLKNLQYLEPVLAFRDEYLYNNWMYALAGHVVSVLLGQTWEEALRTRLLEPLGMRSSRVVGKTVEAADDVMAKPYFLHEDKVEMIDPTVFRVHPQEAAGAIASSADDMVRWMLFLLGEGKTESGQSLVEAHLLRDCFQSVVTFNPETSGTSELWRPRSPVTHVDMGYGYAWFKSAYRGRKMIWHSGGIHSYVSMLKLFPDLNMAVFTSQSGAYPRTITKDVALFLSDLLLEETPQQNQSSICDKAHASNETENDANDAIMDDVINGPLEPYLGTYRHQLLGEVHVVANAARSGLGVEYGQLQGTLNRTSKADSFRLFFTGSRFFLGLASKSNTTLSFPIQFLNLSSGHYLHLNLTEHRSYSSHIFSRDVPPHTTNTGTKLAICTNAIIALVISLLVILTFLD